MHTEIYIKILTSILYCMVFDMQEPTLEDYIQADVNCINLSFLKAYVHDSQEWQFPEMGT